MSLIQSYFRNCQGAVIVFDVCKKDSVIGLPEIVEDFKNRCPENAIDNIALIGNKVDQQNREIST
jgi:GTPase SAR1 family protein